MPLPPLAVGLGMVAAYYVKQAIQVSGITLLVTRNKKRALIYGVLWVYHVPALFCTKKGRSQLKLWWQRWKNRKKKKAEDKQVK